MAINAGDVIYTLRADGGQLQKAMQSATKGAKNLGQTFLNNSRMIGTAMTGMAAGITAALGGTVTQWARYGDEIAKASKRTNTSTEAFSELRHAAELSGASAENLETGLLKLTQNLDRAREGTGAQAEALARLGMTHEQLAGLQPDVQMAMIADALLGVSDAGERSAIAMELFGRRAGPMLLPMLLEGSAGINKMREDARRLGKSLSGENAAAAEKYTDAIKRMSDAWEGLIIQAGPIIAEVFIPFIEKTIEAGKATAAWVKENPALVKSLVTLGGSLAAVLGVLGPILFVLPNIVAGVKLVGAAFTALAGIISAPVLAIVAAIAAIAAAIAGVIVYWDELKVVAKRVLNWLSEGYQILAREISGAFFWLWDSIVGIWDGITATIKAAWQRIREYVGGLIDLIGEAVRRSAQLGAAVVGGGPGIEARASGGPVSAGMPYLVGERGPEMFVPSTSGRIVNARDTSRMRSGPAPTVTVGDIHVVVDRAGATADEIAVVMRDKLQETLFARGVAPLAGMA